MRVNPLFVTTCGQVHAGKPFVCDFTQLLNGVCKQDLVLCTLSLIVKVYLIPQFFNQLSTRVIVHCQLSIVNYL